MTLKQRRLLKNIGKHKTMKDAMLASGYAPSTARQQKEIVDRPAFKDLLEAYLPDDLLLTRHEELVASKNEGVALGAVALGYKVKGKLTPDTQNNFNVGEMSVQFKEKE